MFLYTMQEVKSKNKEAPPYDDTEVVKLPAKRLYTRQQKKQALSLSNQKGHIRVMRICFQILKKLSHYWKEAA